MSDHDGLEPPDAQRPLRVAWDGSPAAGSRSPWRTRGISAALVVVVLVAVPLAVVATRHPHRKVAIRVVKEGAANTVLDALDATTSAGNYDVAYVVHTTPATTTTTSRGDNCTTVSSDQTVNVSCSGGGGGPRQPVDVSGRGTVNLDPYAELTVSSVSGFGEITLRTDGTSVWEYGGADYGTAPEITGGGGQSLSGFAGIVVSTLGPGPGALSMIGLANPTGYLQLEKEAVIRAEAAGTGTVDGTDVTYFDVSVDLAKILDAPDLSAGQQQTISAALQLLDRAGYTSTHEKVAIDAAGFIRQATVVSRFADGSSMTRTTTLSNYGCAGTVVMPGRPVPATTAAGRCVNPDTTTTTAASTTAPATTASPSMTAALATTAAPATTGASSSPAGSTSTSAAPTSATNPTTATTVAGP